MRYVRTKDGIFELVKEDGNWLEIISNFERKMQYHCVIKKHAIIKQADTIEELCDEFVIKGEFGIYTVGLDELDRHAMGQTKEMLLNGQLEAYGAIWIVGENDEPILNSVAKVNGKGVLELL